MSISGCLSFSRDDLRISTTQRVRLSEYGSGRSPIHNYWLETNQQTSRKFLTLLAYPLGMVGYGLSILPRIMCVFKDALMLIATFFYSIHRKFDDSSCKGLRIRLFVLGGSGLEVGASVIGVLCPPLAYKIDDYLQSFFWINILSFFPYGDARNCYEIRGQSNFVDPEQDVANINQLINTHQPSVIEVNNSENFYLDSSEIDPELQRDILLNQLIITAGRNTDYEVPERSRENVDLATHIFINYLNSIAQNGVSQDGFPDVAQRSNDQLRIDASKRAEKRLNTTIIDLGKKAFLDLEDLVDHSNCGGHMQLLTQFLVINLCLDNKIDVFKDTLVSEGFNECVKEFNICLNYYKKSVFKKETLRKVFYLAVLNQFFEDVPSKDEIKSEMAINAKESISTLKKEINKIDKTTKEFFSKFISLSIKFHGSFSTNMRNEQSYFYQESCKS